MPRSLVSALLLLVSFGTLDAAQWHSSGPEGGAVRMLAAAPSNWRVLYFTSGSMLLRSRDLGTTWTTLDAPFAAIATFAIDPHDPQIVFVASPSGALYKTADGGATWTAIGAAPALPVLVTAIVIDPRDGNVVYVSRDCGPYLEPFFDSAGVFKSTDGGLTFMRMTRGMARFQQCSSSLSLDPGDPDVLYSISQFSDDGNARSENGAGTWTRATTIVPTRIVADPRDPQQRYGSARGLFVTSSDGGKTWVSQRPTAVETGSQLPDGSANALAIDEGSGRLFLAGHHGVYRSGDGGRSALALPGPAREITRGVVFDEASGALVIGTVTGVYRSDAYPWTEWTRLRTGDRSVRMLDVAASRIDARTMYAVSTSMVHVTRDHGLTWSPLGRSLPPTNTEAPALGSIAVDRADNVYVSAATGSALKVFKLAAGTEEWVELTTPLPHFTRMLADPGTPGVVYLLRPGTPALMATRDGGATWNYHYTPTGDASSLAIDPRDGAVFYAGTRNALLKSHDGGHTWTALLADKTIVDVQISPADPNSVYAVERQYGVTTDRIHVSHDAGTTWTSHYATGEVVSLALDHRDPRTLVTSLQTGTVHRSRDEGAHWESITGNLPLDRIRLAFSLDGRVLHATTTTRGMWELFEMTRRRAVGTR